MHCVGAGASGSAAKRARTENTVPGDALQQLADAHNATEQARPLAPLPELNSRTLQLCPGKRRELRPVVQRGQQQVQPATAPQTCLTSTARAYRGCVSCGASTPVTQRCAGRSCAAPVLMRARGGAAGGAAGAAVHGAAAARHVVQQPGGGRGAPAGPPRGGALGRLARVVELTRAVCSDKGQGAWYRAAHSWLFGMLEECLCIIRRCKAAW